MERKEPTGVVIGAILILLGFIFLLGQLFLNSTSPAGGQDASQRTALSRRRPGRRTGSAP